LTLIVDGIGGLAMAVAVVFIARLSYDVLRVLAAAVLLSLAKRRMAAKTTPNGATVGDRIRDYRRDHGS
jgi:hypothetical protein